MGRFPAVISTFSFTLDTKRLTGRQSHCLHDSDTVRLERCNLKTAQEQTMRIWEDLILIMQGFD